MRPPAGNDARSENNGITQIPEPVAFPKEKGRTLVLEFARLAEERRAYRVMAADKKSGTKKPKSRKIPKAGSGACSMVTNTAPWFAPVLRQLSHEAFDEYTRQSGILIAEKIKEVTTGKDAETGKVEPGRTCWGFETHWDSRVLHFEHAVPATYQAAEHREIHPKANWLNISDWQLGILRINKSFPDLLSPQDVADAQSYFDKRGGRKIANWEIRPPARLTTDWHGESKKLVSCCSSASRITSSQAPPKVNASRIFPSAKTV